MKAAKRLIRKGQKKEQQKANRHGSGFGCGKQCRHERDTIKNTINLKIFHKGYKTPSQFEHI